MAPRIMIVEREGVVALDIEIILLTAGYQIAATAHTSREAVQRAQLAIPDLALIDIGLTGPIDGIELAQLMQEHLSLSIVFLSGYTDRQTIARASLVRPLGYITKPFGQAELLSSIEVALQQGRDRKGEKVVVRMDGQSAVQENPLGRDGDPS